ncbi:MAG: S46 family peptidase [Deltaproteobacteria bacterium]|nr:S46 family peptidase [Deltaproteobacteria bacterium]
MHELGRRGCAGWAGALVVCLSGAALAAEGMYPLDRLPEKELAGAGLKVTPGELGRLSRAVVQVARGGSGAFVSKQGLLVTNHHVAFGCLARLNALKAHQGIMDRGFVAKAQKDELSCPGYDLLVVRKVEDVTQPVLAAVKGKPHWSKRFEAIRLRKDDLVKACEEGGKQVCQVAEMDGGASYSLTTYLRVRDVRLVYAPAKALGKYGGDIDNWMFPRHTADFTYLRAYVNEKGEGGAFDKANRPLETPVHLKVSTEGVGRGAMVLVMGFPGRTSRHATSHAVRYYVEEQLPQVIEFLDGTIKAVHLRMKASDEARRKYEGFESSLQNGLKYYQMSADGMKRWKTLERKLADEKALLEAQPAGSEARKGAEKVLGEIGAVYGRYRGFNRKMAALGRLMMVSTVGSAYQMAKWAKEKMKPERMRKEEAYKDKNVYRFIEGGARLEDETELGTERALLLHLLRETKKLPAAQQPKVVARLVAAGQKALKKLVAEAKRKGEEPAAAFKAAYGVALSEDPLEVAVAVVYGSTKLVARSAEAKELERAKALRAALFKMKAPELRKQDDPLLRFAADAEAELTALKEGAFKEVEQYLATVLHPRWVTEVKKAAYPDANFTVRLTHGKVADYTATATGKRHRYLSTLSELVAKDKGKFPFEVPAKLKAAFPARASSPAMDAHVKDIPVNFTATLDTTGGNSGSPVIDARGRLVGLLFDGTPESILSDWQFLPKDQRSICLDIRFAHYLAAVDGAERVLKESGVSPAGGASGGKATPRAAP